MTKHALVVKAELTAELIDIAEQELSKLQSAVDGLIQPVEVSENIIMWVNEEGLLRDDLDINYLATAIYSELYNAQMPIMGDIVFTGGADDSGATKSLEQIDIAELTEITRRAKESLHI